MIDKNTPFLKQHFPRREQRGIALFTTLVLIIVVGVAAVSGMRLTEMSEVLSGNSIQRSRALQAAEGGLKEGETDASLAVQQRVFASTTGSTGVFAADSVDDYWWREDVYNGAQQLDSDAFPGVVEAPEFVLEEVGSFISDAGSGIVSLDRGGANYGGLTESGREVVLYRVQTYGVGSTTSSKAVVESLYVENQ